MLQVLLPVSILIIRFFFHGYDSPAVVAGASGWPWVCLERCHNLYCNLKLKNRRGGRNSPWHLLASDMKRLGRSSAQVYNALLSIST